MLVISIITIVVATFIGRGTTTTWEIIVRNISGIIIITIRLVVGIGQVTAVVEVTWIILMILIRWVIPVQSAKFLRFFEKGSWKLLSLIFASSFSRLDWSSNG